MALEIPPHLLTMIREGQVILFLGSGASREAVNEGGKKMPDGKRLGEILSDRFLGGKFKDFPLSQIADYAISESDLLAVQEFIRDEISSYKPTNSHLLLPEFKWWGLATTNYDRLVEDAYQHGGLQTPRPIIENGDRIEELIRDLRSVLFLKLHGCITRTNNPKCPLILATDQYITHLDGRSRLFKRFEEWGTEKTVVFVGYSLKDIDIRTVVLRLANLGEARPRYYMVAPYVTEIEQRFWEQKRITTIPASFEEFMRSLDTEIPKPVRALSAVREEVDIPIKDKFTVKDPALSLNFIQFFENDVDYVKAVASTEQLTPKEFYKGANIGWSAIEQGLDVSRWLADAIISDNFLLDAKEESDRTKLIIIKAHAGAGKTVLLQRIAWDASRGYDCLCLFVKKHGLVNSAAIQETIQLVHERVFLFVDDVADRVKEIVTLLESVGKAGKWLTVIGAERINEWNISCEALNPLVSQSYTLKYLSEKEIDNLLTLLDSNKSLGVLEKATSEQRRFAFKERAGRQLLVALHEATLGRTFEEIVEDEYLQIVPLQAQQIYLTICVLNRYNYPVRAGIISRIHGIPFEDFKKNLFPPLEEVVYTEYNKYIRDFEYRARHPHIAEIVCERILRDQDLRFDQYIKILKALDVDYSSDRAQYRELVKARNLLATFSNHELICRIYEVATEEITNDAFLFHQMAIYELNRDDGNLSKCKELLEKAKELAPYDKTILHSIAEYYLRMAERARTDLEQDKFLAQAITIASNLTNVYTEKPYSYHTIVKAGIFRVRRFVQSGSPAGSGLEIALREIEKSLQEGLQRYPTDPYLKSAESDLAKLLSDSDRAIKALQVAFQANPRSSFLALRLAEQCLILGDAPGAKVILEKALDANPSEKKLHYAYAKHLMEHELPNDETLLYHLKRSFTDGDKNYDAQLLYGRQLFVMNNFIESKGIFDKLGKAYVDYSIRHSLRYTLARRFKGEIARLEATFCFVSRDGLNDWIYVYKGNVSDDLWPNLIRGVRVEFDIAFSFVGPNGCNLSLTTI